MKKKKQFIQWTEGVFDLRSTRARIQLWLVSRAIQQSPAATTEISHVSGNADAASGANHTASHTFLGTFSAQA